LAGFGLGYGIDTLAGGRGGRIAGVFVGVASGIWAAARMVMKIVAERKDDENP
jgi:hypothetical protein